MSDRFSPEYRAHLASPTWNHKREQAFKEHGAYCQRCFTPEQLDVHHLTYKRLGAERMADLAPLCRTCHTELHRLHHLRGGDLWHFSKAFIEDEIQQQRQQPSPSCARIRAARSKQGRRVAAWHLLWLIPVLAVIWINALRALAQVYIDSH